MMPDIAAPSCATQVLAVHTGVNADVTIVDT